MLPTITADEIRNVTLDTLASVAARCTAIAIAANDGDADADDLMILIGREFAATPGLIDQIRELA